MEKDAYLLVKTDSTLHALGGAKYFSTVDLASGYWQVEDKPHHQENNDNDRSYVPDNTDLLYSKDPPVFLQDEPHPKCEQPSMEDQEHMFHSCSNGVL